MWSIFIQIVRRTRELMFSAKFGLKYCRFYTWWRIINYAIDKCKPVDSKNICLKVVEKPIPEIHFCIFVHMKIRRQDGMVIIVIL